jgi:hypothetical protein
MLKRSPTSEKQDSDWFRFAAGLLQTLCADYVSVRLLIGTEPFTTAPTVLPKMLDVAEKALKLHLTVQTKSPTALSSARADYGHHIEGLRASCASIHPVFADTDICDFTRDLNDKDGKLYQFLRYGSQETTRGYEANLGDLLPVVDKIFAKSLLLLPDSDRRVLLFVSPIKNLLTRSQFDQTRDPDRLIHLLRINNAQFEDLLSCFHHLDEEHAALLKQLEAAKGS